MVCGGWDACLICYFVGHNKDYSLDPSTLGTYHSEGGGNKLTFQSQPSLRGEVLILKAHVRQAWRYTPAALMPGKEGREENQELKAIIHGCRVSLKLAWATGVPIYMNNRCHMFLV